MMNNDYTWPEFKKFILNEKFNRPRFILATIISLINSLLSIVISVLLKEFIDQYTKIGSIDQYLLIITSILILKIGLDSIATYMLNIIGLDVINYIRNHSARNFTEIDHSSLMNEQTGELGSYVITDTLSLFSFISKDINTGIVSLFSSLVYLIFLIYLSPKITFVILLVILPLLLGFSLMGAALSKLTFANQQLNAKFTHGLIDTLRKGILIKSQNIQSMKQETLLSLTTKIRNTSSKKLLIATLGQLIISLVGIAGILYIIYFAKHLLTNGFITIGSITAYMITAIQLIPNILNLGGFISTVKQAQGSSQRLFEISKLPTEDLYSGQDISSIDSIQFDHVYFKYGDDSVLNDLSFTLKAGDIVYISGDNGSGKTTILMLIMRFINPSSGKIYINGIDISKISKESLRDNISYANQLPLLLEGSSEFNVSLGSKKSNHGNLHSTLKKYGVAEFSIREDGNNLSGGQKQKIGIARIDFQNRDVIILDETFSSLDKSAKSDLKSLIENIGSQKIVLLVDHEQVINNSTITKTITL